MDEDKIRCEICDKTFDSKEALQSHNDAKHNLHNKHKPRGKSSRKYVYIAIAFLILVVVLLIYIRSTNKIASNSQYDNFAQYLTEKGVVMYGTQWCTHCQAQKKLFGSSFQYINFVDCDQQPDACTAANVTGYPTWIINGQSYPGEQPIAKLAQLTGYDFNHPAILTVPSNQTSP